MTAAQWWPGLSPASATSSVDSPVADELAVRPPVRCRDVQGPPQRQDLPDGPVGLPVLAGHWRDHSRVGLGRQRLAPQYPQQARHPDTGWPQRLRRWTAVPRYRPDRGPCEGVPPGPSLDRSRSGTAHEMALARHRRAAENHLRADAGCYLLTSPSRSVRYVRDGARTEGEIIIVGQWTWCAEEIISGALIH
jgi:hypothetical protein